MSENFEELQKLKAKKSHDDNKYVEKPKWSNDFEFLCSCITLSVGLGNVWRYCDRNISLILLGIPFSVRFPFTALQYGGGSFLIPYTLIVILVGKPLYYLEILLGQFSSKGCIKVYDMAPAVRGKIKSQLIFTQ